MHLLNLFDQNSPKCFYCLGQIVRQYREELSAIFTPKSILTYICPKCQETLVIEYSDYSGIDKITEANIWRFAISCKDLWIQQFAILDKISILDFNLKYLVEEIAFFSPDFSDKNKLYNQLKTYILLK